MAQFGNPNVGEVTCDQEGCTNSVKDHAWGKIKADGWFFSRDGVSAFCPKHLPDWVDGWRKNRG